VAIPGSRFDLYGRPMERRSAQLVDLHASHLTAGRDTADVLDHLSLEVQAHDIGAKYRDLMAKA